MPQLERVGANLIEAPSPDGANLEYILMPKNITELQKQVQEDKLVAKSSEPLQDEFSWIDDSHYMLTGVSLSMCVKQMVEQNIPTSRVWEINSGTSFSNDDQFNQVMDFYAEHYWRKFPEEAKAICSQLRKEGKIQQAKLLPGHVSPPSGYGWDVWLEHGTLNYLNQYEDYPYEK